MANNPYILAGQGTSSCTFAPEHIHLGNTIIQLKKERTAKNNILRVQTLGLPGINEARQKLLYPYEKIEEVPANFPRGKCKLKDHPKNPLKTVKIPYGGKDLSELVVNQEDIYDFFNAFINIFDGLLELHKKNIAHLDVKPANMVGEKEGKTYKLRLIDFGLSKKTDERLDNSEFYTLYSEGEEITNAEPRNYPFWSYELRLLNKVIYTVLYGENIPMDIIDFKNMFSYYKYPKILIEGINSDLVEQLLKNINDDNKSQILLKSDVFSLGLSLYIIWKRVTGYGLDDGGKLTYSLKGDIDNAMVADEAIHYIIVNYPDKKVLPDGWDMIQSTVHFRETGNYTGKNLIYFYNTTSNLSFWDIKKIKTCGAEIEASEKVFELVKKMCNPDPFTRLRLEDALTEYTSLVLPFEICPIQRAYPRVGEIEPVTPAGSPPPTPNKGGSRKLRTRKNKRNNKKYVKPKKKRTTKKH